MKPKSSLFMLAPVVVSLMMLVVLFNPAMAKEFTDDSRGQSARCPAYNMQLSYSVPHGVKGITCISKNNINDLGPGKLSCPFSSIHAFCVKKYHKNLQSVHQNLIDHIRAHRKVRLATSKLAYFGFQRDIESVDAYRRLTYVF